MADAFGADKVDAWFPSDSGTHLVALGVSQTPMAHQQRVLGLDRLPLAGDGRVVEVFRSGTAFATGHADRDPCVEPGFPRQLGVRSMLCVPLAVADERRGLLLVCSARAKAYTATTLRLLSLVARFVGRVAQRAELEQALARQQAAAADRQAVLAAASHAFAAAGLNMRALLDGIARRVGQAFGATCIVQVLVGEGPRLEPVAIYHPDPSRAEVVRRLLAQAPARLDTELNAAVARRGEAVRVADLSLAEQRRRIPPAQRAVLEQMGAHSVVLAPLRVGGRVLGSLDLARDRSQCPLTEDDAVLALDLADRAALALEAAHRFEQSLAAITARDDVLAAVSHDLKAPLAAIAGSAQLLHQQLVSDGVRDPLLVRSAERIVASCRRMAEMMEELVDAVRLEAGQLLVLDRVATDLVALAHAAVADQQATTRQHALHLSATVDQVTGAWDAARLRRVLDNLLANAIKYSPARGEVRVEVGVEGEAGRRWAVVRVADHGLGIPAADLPHIFERFHRARNVAGIVGTGLGLSGGKQIVEQHGGRLDVESHEGVGSTFSVRLPLPAERQDR